MCLGKEIMQNQLLRHQPTQLGLLFLTRASSYATGCFLQKGVQRRLVGPEMPKTSTFGADSFEHDAFPGSMTASSEGTQAVRAKQSSIGVQR